MSRYDEFDAIAKLLRADPPALPDVNGKWGHDATGQLQTHLKNLGFFEQPKDGQEWRPDKDFGPKTASYLTRAMHEDPMLVQSVSDRTWSALRKDFPFLKQPLEAVLNKAIDQEFLNLNDVTPDANGLYGPVQKLLHRAGRYDGPMDGYDNDAFRAAQKKFFDDFPHNDHGKDSIFNQQFEKASRHLVAEAESTPAPHELFGENADSMKETLVVTTGVATNLNLGLPT